MFQSLSPMSSLAAKISGKIRDHCIHRENLQKQAFSTEFTFLTSKKSCQVLFYFSKLFQCLIGDLNTGKLKYVNYSVHSDTHSLISSHRDMRTLLHRNVAFHFILCGFFNRPIQASNPFDCVTF